MIAAGKQRVTQDVSGSSITLQLPHPRLIL